MKRDRLFRVLGRIDEKWIEEADREVLHRRQACGMRGYKNEKGGGASEGDYTFISYAGLVLPLTLCREEPDVTADRSLTYRILGTGDSQGGNTLALVTDTYVLYNYSGKEKTVEAAYPFISGLKDLEQSRPSVQVGENQISASLLAGGYPGGFDPDSPGGSSNMSLPRCFEDLQAFMEGREDLEKAVKKLEGLDRKVTVYEDGRLEGIFEDCSVNRVMYLVFEVCIPAGESAVVRLEGMKAPSQNPGGVSPEQGGVQRYECAISLGSNLSWETVNAELIVEPGIEVLRQSFGFIEVRGRNEAVLDPGMDCCYLDVR